MSSTKGGLSHALHLIATKFYGGFKATTDTRYAEYAGPDTKNRIATKPRS